MVGRSGTRALCVALLCVWAWGHAFCTLCSHACGAAWCGVVQDLDRAKRMLVDPLMTVLEDELASYGLDPRAMVRCTRRMHARACAHACVCAADRCQIMCAWAHATCDMYDLHHSL